MELVFSHSHFYSDLSMSDNCITMSSGTGCETPHNGYDGIYSYSARSASRHTKLHL